MAKVCISGNYGQGGPGAELELAALIAALRRQAEDCEIVVFSPDPAQIEADFDVKAVADHFETIKGELASADLFISGGGEVLRETEDLAELKNYLRILKAAQHHDVPVFVYYQTIPAFSSPRAKSMVVKAMQKVRKITVADEESAARLKDLGIRPGRIHVVGNPLLLMTAFDPEWNISLPAEKPEAPAPKQEQAKTPTAINYDGMEVELEIRVVTPEEAAAAAVKAEAAVADEGEVRKKTGRGDDLKSIVPSFWKKPGEKFAAFFVSPCVDLPVAQITALADEMAEKGYCVVFLPLDYDNDIALIGEIRGMMKHPSFIVNARMSPLSVFTAVQETDFVFSTGIEGIYAAVICRKPFASLCVNDEMTATVKALGTEPTAVLAEYNGEAFMKAFEATLAQPEAVVDAVEENLPVLRESAEEGLEQLTALFEIIDRRKAREARVEENSPQAKAEEHRREQAKSILGFDKIKEKMPKRKGNAVEEELAEPVAEEAAADEGNHIPDEE